jgi:GNAT superfamily N-acetyltransferase
MADLQIRKFEPADQAELEGVYRSGMNVYADIPVISECTAWFVEDKLRPGGDMSDVQAHYMDNADGKKRCFWVAVLESKIVGCVGAIPSTKYSENYVELVRMSVSATCRKVGIGSRMLNSLAEWAKQEGYQHINLSTLLKMHLGVEFYIRNGFTIDKEEEVNVAPALKSSEPLIITVVHFVKPIL